METSEGVLLLLGSTGVLSIAAGGFAGMFSDAWITRDYDANYVFFRQAVPMWFMSGPAWGGLAWSVC